MEDFDTVAYVEIEAQLESASVSDRRVASLHVNLLAWGDITVDPHDDMSRSTVRIGRPTDDAIARDALEVTGWLGG
jgi:hypothetical protein